MSQNKKMLANKTIEVVHGSGQPTHAIIWLHGLGASSDDFPPVVPHLGLNSSPAIRFIFPQAPDRPITINNGFVIPGWYDIKGMALSDKEDLVGMTESQDTVLQLIAEQQAQGIPSEHIIIAGFSQGGAVAYYTGLRTQKKLAGIMALSTYMPFVDAAKVEQSSINLGVEILSMHGVNDPVVPISLGLESVHAAKKLGYHVAWNTYDMEHSVIPEQLVDIGEWINRVFS